MQISLFGTNGPINNMLVLLQVLSWHQTGVKPSPEVVVAKFHGGMLGHLVQNELSNVMPINEFCICRNDEYNG